ncbi:MAG: sugar phosphate isomerase/epimerase family protein [Eubacteriales bacterium]
MRLATSTCIYPTHRQGGRTPLEESIKMCYETGFRVFDLNFCGASSMTATSELHGDDWEKNVESIGELAAKLGVEFSQSHMPFDSNLYRPEQKLSDEYRAWYAESCRRSIIASARLGVKWVVTHAQTATENDEMSFEENMRANIHFYTPLLELAKKEGTGIAIENMAEFHPAKTKHRFTAVVEEQIAIIDALGDPHSCRGCWDFGHAQLVYRDQSVPLRKLGHRLAATHVQECDGREDDHYLPFVRGTTNWEMLMPLLKEIGYDGDFTYEVHGFYAKIPDDLRLEAGKLGFKIGNYLMELYNKA